MMLLQILLTIGVAQALTLAVMLLIKKQKNQSDYLLSIELLLLFLITILFVFRYEIAPVLPGFAINAILLTYLAVPIFYLFARTAAGERINFLSPKIFLHFAPFILAYALFTVNFQTLPYVDKCLVDEMIHHGGRMPCPTWFWLIYYGVFCVQFPFYLWRTYKVLNKHEHYLLASFSYTEDINLQWLLRFLWGLTFMWGLIIGFEIIGGNVLGLVDDQVGFYPAIIAMVLLVLYLGIAGLRHRVIFFEEEEILASPPVFHTLSILTESEDEQKYVNSNLTEAQAQAYLQQIEAYMLQEKPYLEPRITIGELAQRLQIPVNDLSQIINEQLEQNFYDFINSYRVEAFKELLSQPDSEQFTLLSLGLEAGFNSKSTFNAIVKKFTGLTPSQYARQQRAVAVNPITTSPSA